MPHGHCYLWTPVLLWMYVVSDTVIAISYYTIPIALLYLVKKRADLEFNWVFVMFSLFIFACGTTHLIGILTIWHPAYWLDATMKSVTAVASGITAIMLWRLMPVALTITSNKQLRTTIARLESEVQKRMEAERALATLNSNLEHLVRERTEDLSNINSDLLQEIEQRKRTELELFNQKQLAIVTLESIGDAVITTNMQSEVTYLNPVAEKMTGWSKSEAQGRPILEVFRILNESTRKLAANPVDVVLAHNKVCGLANHTLLIAKSGVEYAIEDSAAPIRDPNGAILGVVLVFHDVSDARQMAQKMTYLAEHDYLTDLPNRLLLTDRITQAISAAQRRQSKLAILFCDIDHFKRVNDTLGHEVGDQLLKVLCQRLQLCIRASDTLSRLGGDEFVVLLPELNDDAVPAEIAQKILTVLKDPVNIAGHELFITASIGIAVYPDDGQSEDVLTRHADAAMYHAKNSGRNNYQFFTHEMSERVAAQLMLENSLQKAISNNELHLFYQPKVSINTGKIIGAEALIRWMHPQWGMMMPDRFIKVAEESGLIKGIGLWVLREACTQNKKWQAAGLPEIPIAINVSVVELHHANFMQEVVKVLLQTGLHPHHLELEVTESVAIQSEVTVIQDLNKLKEMGVRLSVDDFGTGYSSLSYLKLLPVNTIKIDKSFIRDIQVDANDAAIVNAIIKMSQSLGLTVIAEGVETEAQLAFLKSHNCDEMQGYLFSRPLPADEFAALLATQ
ncbi:EAL domain-containing protein [Methylophilus medardicus]|uniref:EAL domain-containing protein n=2 Tax=Methylophilus medardicus TaxID=2588534 RepID=A0A5B8CXQ0_9PROT|nr:EAL domain-containing protein [Methylophilus medardicus]QDC50372.1 EAL domain-containing protein [Methylophilus medardicus]QDC54077.1 EAL domain-containing protein [Methylophilus medardicus]